MSGGPANGVAAAAEDAIGKVAALLLSSQRILLTSHRRPDGDGTGSMAGLASLLRARGKHAVIYSMDPIARRYKWLPLVETTVSELPSGETYDCTVVVDCADITLLGNALPPPDVRGVLVTLDHHASGRPFGELAVWDPSAAAVGVLIARIAHRLQWPITPEAAVPLYVSLISDTGGFRHANTNAEALRIASELVTAGVQPTAVASGLEERPSLGKLKLLGAVLSTLQMHCSARVGMLLVTTEMIDRNQATWDDVEGMVNWARNVEGVHVGVMLTTAKGGGIRVSMRSRTDRIDVGRVCMQLGGGGHPGAGGCHLEGDMEEARRRVVAVLDLAFLHEGPLPRTNYVRAVTNRRIIDDGST